MTDLPDDWYEEVDGRSRCLNAKKVEEALSRLLVALQPFALRADYKLGDPAFGLQRADFNRARDAIGHPDFWRRFDTKR